MTQMLNRSGCENTMKQRSVQKSPDVSSESSTFAVSNSYQETEIMNCFEIIEIETDLLKKAIINEVK